MISSSCGALNPAAETLDGDRSELAAIIVRFVPDVGKGKMLVSLAPKQRAPFVGIVADDQKIVTFSKARIFVRYGVNGAVVFLFNLFHFCFYFGFLFDPKSAEIFIEANAPVLFKAFDIGFVNI